MLGQVAAVVVALLLVLATGGLLFFIGMRAKSPLVQRPVVWFSKHVVNPRQLRSAGTPGAYASVIGTIGRKSGRAYQTPVSVVTDDDGFLVALPYGTRPQWLRNLQAAGSGTLVHDGSTYAVDRPEIVPMADVEDRFPPSDQRTHRLFNVDQCVRIRVAAPAEPSERLTPAA